MRSFVNDPVPSQPNLARLKSITADRGARAAIIFLNGLTAHRFTALYRFDHATLRNIYFFDRENPAQDHCPEIPVLASYCVFVRDSGRPFCTENSLRDFRVDGHPKQRQVQSYCGVPLLDGNGKMFGTICHFDFNPKPISAPNVELMENLATILKGNASAAGQ